MNASAASRRSQPGRRPGARNSRNGLSSHRSITDRLRGRQQLAITSIAAALGLLMIIRKDVILIHLH
jgi:hypothetical protein